MLQSLPSTLRPLLDYQTTCPSSYRQLNKFAKPGTFCTSVNVWWFTREALEKQHTLCRVSQRSVASVQSPENVAEHRIQLACRTTCGRCFGMFPTETSLNSTEGPLATQTIFLCSPELMRGHSLSQTSNSSFSSGKIQKDLVSFSTFTHIQFFVDLHIGLNLKLHSGWRWWL